MKPSGPLLGYNNNIPHRGRTYHVQTEDSGVRRPHVITHLFADGGRIVKTTKSSYAHLVGLPDQTDRVRELMKEQHKAMITALRESALDELLLEGTGPPGAGATPLPNANAFPSEPIDLLERAADAMAESPLPRSLSEPPPASARRGPTSPGDEGPGTYRFVGPARKRSQGGGPPSQPPPTTQRFGSADTSRIDRATHPDRTTPVEGPAGKSTRPDRATPVEGPGGGTPVPASSPRRTVPDPSAARSRSALETGFGGAFVSDRPLAELMLAFLARRAGR